MPILIFILMLWNSAGLQAQSLDLTDWNREPKALDALFWVLPEVQDPALFQTQLPPAAQDLARIETLFSQLKIGRLVNPQDSIAFALELRHIAAGDYGLRLRADTAVEAWLIPMNGPVQNAVRMGRAGHSAADTIPEVGDRLGRFHVPEAGTYWLLINVANYHYKEGRIWKKPVIGDYEAMHRLWLLEILQEAFILGIITILTIYNLALFLNRPEDSSNLWLAGYCFFALLRCIGISGVNLPILFPEPSVALHHVCRLMEIAFMPITSCFFVNFFISNFSDWAYWRRKAQIFMAVALVYVLIALSIETRRLPDLILPLDLFILCSTGINLTLIIKAIRKRMTGARTMLGGGLIYLGTIIHDILGGLSIVHTSFFLASYGLAVFIFFQGQVVAKLFAKAFRTARLLSEHLEDEVDKKTRDIQSMLDNIPLGICSVDAGGRILPNHSSQLPEILGLAEPAGKEFVSAIFGRSNMSIDARDMVQQSLNTCLGEDAVFFEANTAHLPAEITLAYDDQKHFLQCIWSPITDKANCVVRILLVLRDITSLKQAEIMRLEQQRELEYIIELVNVTPDRFENFMTSSTQFLSENDRLIRQNPKKDPEIVKIIFVNMHTIKGAARTLGFYKMTSLLHEVEQVYSAFLKDPTLIWNRQKLLDDMSEVKTVFDYYMSINHEKLGRKASNTLEVSISRQTLEDQDRALRSIQISRLAPKDAQILLNTIHQIEDFCFSDASDVFLDILSSVQRVARDLGKEIPIINVDAKGFKFKQSAHKLLSNVFVHIIRNSLDHGIETAAERIAIGKRPTGRIDVQLEQQGEMLIIRYRDDGRGLNMQLLREKASRAKLLSDAEAQDPERLAQLIFIPGLSTAHALTEVSGRGIGMDAVKRHLENENGEIHLEVGEEIRGFASFTIRLCLASSHFLTVVDELEQAG